MKKTSIFILAALVLSLGAAASSYAWHGGGHAQAQNSNALSADAASGEVSQEQMEKMRQLNAEHKSELAIGNHGYGHGDGHGVGYGGGHGGGHW